MSKEKETIINGIDVSECEFLECGMCNAQRNCDGYTGIECKYDNENCYYRQLKRLQQELDIKEKMLDKFMIGSGKTLEKLQEENKELKSRNANLRLNLATYDLPEIKKVLTDWRTGKLDIKFKKLQKENEKLKKLKCEFKEYCTCDTEKYRSALEEIRKAIGKKYGMADIIKIRTIFDEVLNDRN